MGLSFFMHAAGRCMHVEGHVRWLFALPGLALPGLVSSMCPMWLAWWYRWVCAWSGARVPVLHALASASCLSRTLTVHSCHSLCGQQPGGASIIIWGVSRVVWAACRKAHVLVCTAAVSSCQASFQGHWEPVWTTLGSSGSHLLSCQ